MKFKQLLKLCFKVITDEQHKPKKCGT